MDSASEIIRELVQQPALRAARQQLDPQRVLDTAIEIQQIAAPTFAERQRAEQLYERFSRYARLENVAMDELDNVYGCLPGTEPGRPALLVSAHTDTVFSADTKLTVQRLGHRIYGPGLGDNSLGVAGLLTLLNLIHAADLRPAADIWFVANSREEGLGDLGGIRMVWQHLGPLLGAAVVIEGMALGHIYHAGIAVRRLHITGYAPGGHSWQHFGQPSAIHGLVQLASQILSIQPPEHPRTTYNIGLIEGGHSVNSLATAAGLYLDLRSEEPATLAELEQQVRRMCSRLESSSGVSFKIEVVGDRPAGQIAVNHPLVELAAAALDEIGLLPVYERGSTDANMLLAHGLPTVTVGVSYGGHAHRLDELIDVEPVAGGMWQLLLLVMAAASHTAGLKTD